jgi:hypothetical protein
MISRFLCNALLAITRQLKGETNENHHRFSRKSMYQIPHEEKTKAYLSQF